MWRPRDQRGGASGCAPITDAPPRLPRHHRRPTCLTRAQLTVVRKIYSGAVTDRAGTSTPGGQPFGSELAWAGWMIPVNPTAPQSSTIAWRIGNGWVNTSPSTAIRRPRSPSTISRSTGPPSNTCAGSPASYDAIDPDLSAFRRAGGKLILWHGWADQAIPPTGTVAYYQAVQDRMGGLAAAQRWWLTIAGRAVTVAGKVSEHCLKYRTSSIWAAGGQSQVDGCDRLPLFGPGDRVVMRR